RCDVVGQHNQLLGGWTSAGPGRANLGDRLAERQVAAGSQVGGRHGWGPTHPGKAVDVDYPARLAPTLNFGYRADELFRVGRPAGVAVGDRFASPAELGSNRGRRRRGLALLLKAQDGVYAERGELLEEVGAQVWRRADYELAR